jgi:hypothetical protein
MSIRSSMPPERRRVHPRSKTSATASPPLSTIYAAAVALLMHVSVTLLKKTCILYIP